jgi:hypothetical protein
MRDTGEYLNEKTYHSVGKYWYKHKMLRRSFNVIRKALPNMFHYLDNPYIPRSTNPLESFFGNLKTQITIQRGLSKPMAGCCCTRASRASSTMESSLTLC